MRASTSDFTGKKKASGSNDIFEKCRNFTRPSDLQNAGLYMYFEVFGERDGCGAGEVRMGKRKVLMFGSNDYLDLITHPKVKVRPIDMKDFEADVGRVWDVYGAAWASNWGFVPMSREEFFQMGKEMKMILKPELVLIGEVGNKVVGFALALPDVNQALKTANGSLFPTGLLKILYYQRLIRSVRVLALGVVEEYRTSGLAAGFYATLVRNARKLGFGETEMSWILEDNVLMNRSLEAMGAKRYKTYRIYDWN